MPWRYLMSEKPHSFGVCVVRLLLGWAPAIAVSGCSTLGSGSSTRPEWISQPKSADSINMYAVGHGSGRATREQAQAAAYQDALAQISKAIFSSVTTDGRQTTLKSQLDIKGAEIMPGCVYPEKTAGGYDCWVQVKYPLAEREKIAERVLLGEQLNGLWREAKSHVVQGKHQEAIPILKALVVDFEKGLCLEFAMAELQAKLGKAYEEQKQYFEAALWYKAAGDVEGLRRVEGVLPSHWPLNDRFGGRKVALLCCLREGGACERSSDLANILSSRLLEVRLDSVDVAEKERLSASDMAVFFDSGRVEAPLAAGVAHGGGVLLAVLIDIDPAKRGKKTRVFDVDTPMIDTRVRFRVMAVPGGAIVYDGEFKDIAGDSSKAHVADRAAGILLQNYLVPKCPAVR